MKNSQVRKQCEQCGKKFNTFRSLAPTRRFCCKGCYVQWKRDHEPKWYCADCGKQVQNPYQKKISRCLLCWRKWRLANPDKFPNWKGGRVYNQRGYVWVLARDHPNRNKHTNKVAEHRLVMEQKLGRLLRSDEHVHHLNEIKDDNRPENLVLTNGRDHIRTYHHHSPLHCKMCNNKGQTRRGYCYTHYERWRAAGFAGDTPAPDKPKHMECRICGAKHCAKGLCVFHYYQQKRVKARNWAPDKVE